MTAAVSEARVREIVREELAADAARRREEAAAHRREADERAAKMLREMPRYRDGQWHFPADDDPDSSSEPGGDR